MPRAPTDFGPKVRPFVSPFETGAHRAEFAEQLKLYGFGPPFLVPEIDVSDDEPRSALEWLDVAAGAFLAFDGVPRPVARERRERLESIDAAARAKDRLRLDRLLARTGSGWAGLEGESFAKVRARVTATRRGLKCPRPPVHGDPGLRILIRDLAQIWRAGTGRPATLVWNDYEERRCGPYFDFLRFVIVSRLKVEMSDESLAGLHHRYGLPPKPSR